MIKANLTLRKPLAYMINRKAYAFGCMSPALKSKHKVGGSPMFILTYFTIVRESVIQPNVETSSKAWVLIPHLVRWVKKFCAQVFSQTLDAQKIS